ncbi:PatB family C-S lyase [Caldifermentibacillus hisashii]|uniref:MalY/PatB family protein n=1 Tax=Caldifermentibacillus hisashii TaxID=996558 RepID=UPI0031FDB385
MKNIFDEVVDRKGTYCTQWDFVKDRFGVSDLLPFTISDTDFKAPEGTIKMLEEAVKRGLFGYTRWNHSDFKNSVARWFKKRFNTEIHTDWIVYSPSVVFSIAKCIEILTNPDDNILTFSPAYDAFFQTVKSNNRNLIRCSLLEDENGRYKIDFIDLEKKLSDHKTKVFLLCSPHNPTGRVWTEDELTEIVKLCQKYDKYIISDEIHMDILRNGFHHIPITNFINEKWKKVILLTSSSKTFNTPSLIFSYGLIVEKDIRDEFLKTLKNRNGLSSCSYLGMLATMECYNNEEKWCDELCKYMDNQFSYLEKEINMINGFKMNIPEATYLAWINVKNLNLPMEELQDQLINIGKIAIMRGDTYGTEGSGYLRMNIGAPRPKIVEGVDRIRKALKSLD